MWYKQIEKYIKGELTPDQIDELWIEFLKDSKLFDYFLIHIHISRLAHSQNKPTRERKL